VNGVIGVNRRLVTSFLAVVLMGQFVAAWVVSQTAHGKASTPWPFRVAVVGDQYTAGVQNRQVWPTLLAQRTGRSVSNFALPDAGYVADGRGGHGFTYQVDRAHGAKS
jgi:hypothetical protein